MTIKWIISITYLIFTFIIPSLGVPSNIYFLFRYSNICFLVVIIALFCSTFIHEFKKINLKQLFKSSIFAFSILFLINILNTPFSKGINPNEVNGSLFLFFFSAITYGTFLEEGIFRFCMIDPQANKKQQYISILISSFLFSIVHGGALSIFFIGIILSFVYIKTKNIWYSIVAHGFYNTIGILIYLLSI
ncbi:CPBP family intramembrane metalloprotease [Enterococcus hirae]|uniref:CPBP family intramembrane glutamic endopeptidase n=1 Tax=Enterococcus hirae TaxID=1354 RepID=UPI001094BB49|nr:type II CAAX endopeptidase family protein [Enterococcus hirae]MCR1913381.1 CPBP family intramembrane metalloprotease [Enterococcus hirae]QQU12390.1 CPBP family intramembrane metalloprotease [Enterococcus hirae]TGY23687.1 CPBP family intramembrane metalloprotease [Enterococcus hirae]